MPEDLETVQIQAPSGGIGIAHLLKEAGLVESTSEAFRMMKQGAVKIDGAKAEDKDLQLHSGFSGIMQVGKRKMIKVELI